MAGKKKELGVDSMGIQKTMTKLDYLGDSSGQISLNLLGGLVGQLIYFYTDKVGLAAGIMATLLLIVKVIGAFADLFMGEVVDSTKSDKGKCRPWFLRMALPSVAAIILIFTVPKNISPGMQNIYVLVTNLFLTCIVYTAIAIPYGAIMATRTKSVEERGKIGIARAASGYVVGMVVSVLLIPLTNMLGGNQAAWIKLGVIFAVVSGLSLLFLYKTSREENIEEESEKEEKSPFFQSLRLLFKNKYWVIMLGVNLFLNISSGLSMSGGAYFSKWILGNENLVALMGAVGLIPTFLGFTAVGPMVKKFGMAKTSQICCGVGVMGGIIRVFTPYSLISCLTAGGLMTFANIPIMCLSGALVNNCVEYNEWLSGKKLVGMTNSASSFGSKIGSGIGGSLIGWLLALGAYDAKLKVQPDSAIYAIFGFSIYIPLILFIIMFFLFSKYNLENIYPQIVKDLKERREKHGTV
ncbi:MFS transporter [Lacrimispora sp.]|uniref:MFS transporter n=1 Tax=Lacrimispora sp. TaxID=2719234 RepID=UPI0028A780C0|nr:glycoside-pentoside-hexuronide (GPH):cation symporter [Lacrimispora sp.]